MPRVLITGGTGFLGAHLADHFAAAGYAVRTGDVNPPDPSAPHEFVHLDVRDAAAVRAAAEDCEVIVNDAALVPVTKSDLATYRAVNVGGTENVVAAARATGAYVVHISSTSLYGQPPVVPITPQTPFIPFETYGRSKTEAELVVQRVRAEGMTISSLRPRTIVGTGRLGLFDVIFPRIRDGKAVPLFGKGDNLLQLLDADDMCTAVLKAVELRSNGSYNVGALEFGTVREDFERLIAHAGTDARLVGVPVWAIHAVVKPLDAVGRSPFTPWHYMTAHLPYYCDVSQTVADLDWHPQRSNAEMLINAYDWFVAHAHERGESAHRRPLEGGLAKLLRG
ncbi:MAG TPA: NAD(P)-dependent oxidoreductase [Baekduia sp.]